MYKFFGKNRSAWANSDAEKEACNIINLLKKPKFYNSTKGGFVVWDAEQLQNVKLFGSDCCFSKVMVKDDSIAPVFVFVKLPPGDYYTTLDAIFPLLPCAYDSVGGHLMVRRDTLREALQVMSMVVQKLANSSIVIDNNSAAVARNAPSSSDAGAYAALCSSLAKLSSPPNPTAPANTTSSIERMWSPRSITGTIMKKAKMAMQETFIDDPWYAVGGRVAYESSRLPGDILSADESRLQYYNMVTPPSQRDMVLEQARLERMQNLYAPLDQQTIHKRPEDKLKPQPLPIGLL